MFTERGTEYEPCLRKLHEKLTGMIVYDGGYWVPKGPLLADFMNDSPDAILAAWRSADDDRLTICGVGEYKFPMSYETFDTGHVPWGHVVQCHVHCFATGSQWCHYLAVKADEKIRPWTHWGPDEPLLQRVMYATVYFSEGFMNLILTRLESARLCIRLNQQFPAAPLQPRWGHIKFIETARDAEGCVTYRADYVDDYHRHLTNLPEVFVKIKYHKVNVAQLNKERVLRGWRKDKNPDGLDWQSIE